MLIGPLPEPSGASDDRVRLSVLVEERALTSDQ